MNGNVLSDSIYKNDRETGLPKESSVRAKINKKDGKIMKILPPLKRPDERRRLSDSECLIKCVRTFSSGRRGCEGRWGPQSDENV